MKRAPALAARPSTVAVAMLTVLAGLLALLAPQAARAAEDPAPYQRILAVTGLTWELVDPEITPTLACLAENHAVGALSVRSTTTLTTTSQGLESLRTGQRGLGPASEADPQPVLPEDLVEIQHLGTIAPRERASAAERAAQAGAIDEAVAEAIGPGGCENPDPVLIASVADIADGEAGEPRDTPLSDGVQARVHVLIDTTLPAGALTSPSTRQPGLVQIVDLAPTVLERADVARPADLPGAVMTAEDVEDPVQLVRDHSAASLRIEHAIAPIGGAWALLLLASLIGMVAVRRRQRLGRPVTRLRRVVRTGLLACPTLFPAGLLANAVPWWRSDHPTLVLAATMAMVMAVMTGIALLGPWRRSPLGPPAVIGLLVSAVFVVEALTGSTLQTNAFFGSQPTVAGRFYGISNPQFALTLSGSLVFLAGAYRLTRGATGRVLWTVVVGGLVVVVCLAPQFGADFGSVLAALPAYGVLLLLVSGLRVRAGHVLMLALLAIAAVATVSIFDFLGPEDERTHLGRFVQTVLDGEALDVVTRKLEQNVAIMLNPPLLLLIPVVLLALTVLLTAPGRMRAHGLVGLYERFPHWRNAMIALFTGAWIGFVVNDTGAVLATVAMMAALTLTGAALLGQARPSGTGSADSAAGSARAGAPVPGSA